MNMHDLMHDFDVVSRISGLIGSLKGEYEVSRKSQKNFDELLTKKIIIH